MLERKALVAAVPAIDAAVNTAAVREAALASVSSDCVGQLEYAVDTEALNAYAYGRVVGIQHAAQLIRAAK